MKNSRVTVSVTSHQIYLEDGVMIDIELTVNSINVGLVHPLWQ